MKAVEVPQNQVKAIVREKPEAVVVDVGPPKGVDPSECSTARALRQSCHFGEHDTYEWSVYFQPSSRDLAWLNDNGLIKINMIGDSMVPHSCIVVGDD